MVTKVAATIQHLFVLSTDILLLLLLIQNDAFIVHCTTGSDEHNELELQLQVLLCLLQ